MQVFNRTVHLLLIFLVIVLCQSLNTHTNAMAEARKLAQVQIPASDPLLAKHAEDLISQGDEAFQRHQYQEALHFYHKAVAIFHDLEKQSDKKNTLIRVARVYFLLDRYDEAQEIARRILEIAWETKDSFSEGITLILKGDIYRRQYRLFEALQTYQQAHHQLNIPKPQEESHIKGYQISVLANIANTYSDLSQYQDAAQFYQQALTLLEQSEDLKLKGAVLRDLGTTYIRLGRYEEALAILQQALKIFESLADRENQANVLISLGGIYEEWGEYKLGYSFKSLHSYQKALAIQQDIGNKRNVGIILNNIGKTLDRFAWNTKRPADHKQALALYDRALERLQSIDAQAITAKTFNNIGEVHIHLSFEQNTGAHLEAAFKNLIKAKAIQEDIRDRSRLWITCSNLGQVYELQGKIEDALKAYCQSIAIFEEIVALTAIEEFTISLREQIDTTYQRAVSLFLATGQKEQAFNFSERARARAFLDQLGYIRSDISSKVDQDLLQQKHTLQLELADIDQRLRKQDEVSTFPHDDSVLKELERQFQEKRKEYANLLLQIKLSNPECDDLNRINPLKLSEIQDLLDQETTLLSYFVTPEHTLACVITHNAFHVLELPLKAQDLKSAIRKFRKLHNWHSDAHKPPPKILQELYEQLISPLKTHLTTPVIGIIPHDILHYLSFAALSDGQSYLCDKYTLFTLPSASVLRFLQKKPKSGSQQILAMANSQFAKDVFLPYTLEEVQAIKNFYGRYYETDIYLSSDKIQDATESVFKNLAGEYNILHLAAHGILETDTPLFSGITLSPDEENDGRLEVHELYDLNLERTKLVVLSACDTQLGQRSRGDDIIGLTRAFLYAGASSVIASLWKVDDRATYELMKHFYLQLAVTHSPAKALRAAQRITRHTYPHPYYWASFVLTGIP